MRVLHVIPRLSSKDGGPTRSVKGLCRALSLCGIDVSLLVLRGAGAIEGANGVNIFYGDIPDLRAFDIVHVNGIWDPKIHQVVTACREASIKYMISPRGMLDPWALSVKRLKKQIAMLLYQRKDLECANAFHVTAAKEAESVMAQGLKQYIVVAPNGVDIPTAMPPRKVSSGERTALFLSRLHPGKGLMSLAKAWCCVRPTRWRMKVVGPDTYGHKKEIIGYLQEKGFLSEWEFVDEVDDVKKWDMYRAADLLVHPSVSENFGITIAEGLAAELPVICTKGTPWKELEDRSCGWWIDVGVEPLVTALKVATSMTDNERHVMGERGRRLVEEKYTWNVGAKKLIAGYGEVLYGRA